MPDTARLAAPLTETAVHVISRADAVEGAHPIEWEDPDGISVLSPGKRRAILENPFSIDPAEPARLIGTDAGRVIGCLDVFPGRLAIAGEKVPCLYASGLYVAPQFRQVGMGAMLLLRVQGLHHTIAACGVSQQAYPLYKKLRWLDFPLQRNILVRRSGPLLERYARGRALKAAGTIVADSALAVHRVVAGGPVSVRLRGLSCEQVDSLPSDVDDVADPVDEQVTFDRSAAWVNWLLRNSFESHSRNRRGLFVVRDASGQRVAYFVITARFHERASRRELPNLLLGSLQDWRILKRGAIDREQIILASVHELSKWGVDAVEVCLGDADHVPRLWRWGFKSVEGLHLFVKTNPGSPLRDERFASSDAWRLRPGDGDNGF